MVYYVSSFLLDVVCHKCMKKHQFDEFEKIECCGNIFIKKGDMTS